MEPFSLFSWIVFCFVFFNLQDSAQGSVSSYLLNNHSLAYGFKWAKLEAVLNLIDYLESGGCFLDDSLKHFFVSFVKWIVSVKPFKNTIETEFLSRTAWQAVVEFLLLF